MRRMISGKGKTVRWGVLDFSFIQLQSNISSSRVLIIDTTLIILLVLVLTIHTQILLLLLLVRFYLFYYIYHHHQHLCYSSLIKSHRSSLYPPTLLIFDVT